MGNARIVLRSVVESIRGFFEDEELPLASVKESKVRFEGL